MTSPRDTSLVEEEGAEGDEAKQEEGAVESDCRDLNCTSLRFTVAVSMAHMIEKWLEEVKGT